jgi:hypothetical protein
MELLRELWDLFSFGIEVTGRLHSLERRTEINALIGLRVARGWGGGL